MQEQNALGSKEINRKPKYTDSRIARVTSIKDFNLTGRISAVFLDYSQPVPIWCFGHVDREPVEGDTILVGFIDGRKDAPYLHSFLKNDSYGTNFVVIKRDKIKLQLPVFSIGVIDGTSHKDVKGHLLDSTKQPQRAYIELTPTHAYVSFPTSEDGSTAPATIELTATGASVTTPKGSVVISSTGIVVDHPTGTVKHHGGSTGVARIGDAVLVTISGVDHVGIITTGSTKTLVD